MFDQILLRQQLQTFFPKHSSFEALMRNNETLNLAEFIKFGRDFNIVSALLNPQQMKAIFLRCTHTYKEERTDRNCTRPHPQVMAQYRQSPLFSGAVALPTSDSDVIGAFVRTVFDYIVTHQRRSPMYPARTRFQNVLFLNIHLHRSIAPLFTQTAKREQTLRPTLELKSHLPSLRPSRRSRRSALLRTPMSPMSTPGSRSTNS